MKKAVLVIAAGLVFSFAAQALFVGRALAIDEPQNVVKYRQAVMKAIGGHTGAIVGVVKGEVSYVAHVTAHARGINEMSKLIPDLFPPGTSNADVADSRALPKIWEDRAKFDAAAKELEVQSAKLITAAEGGDAGAIGAQLQNLGKACGGCHKPFRAEKK